MQVVEKAALLIEMFPHNHGIDDVLTDIISIKQWDSLTLKDFLLNVILDTSEHTKKFNGVRDAKIPLTGTILSISQAQIKINNRSCIISRIRFTTGFCYVTKRHHASYESITLESVIIMKLGWLHFKAGKGYQPGMCISFG